jgi:3-oxoacyl-[acyl-carrier protein] reductase
MLISGSRSGLGRAIAEDFANKGWNVHGCSRTEATWHSDRYHHSIVDVSRPRDVLAWVRRADKESSGIDVAIANAATVPAPRPAALGVDDGFTALLATNVVGSAAVLAGAASMMIRRKAGRLLAMSSFAAVAGQPGTSQYASSKAAIETYAKVLAAELSSTGVTCNVLAPSVYESEGLQNIGDVGRVAALASLAIARPLHLSEIIAAINYLISPEAAAITGQVLRFGTTRP